MSGDSETPLNRARITTHSPGNDKQPLQNCSIFGGDKLQATVALQVLIYVSKSKYPLELCVALLDRPSRNVSFQMCNRFTPHSLAKPFSWIGAKIWFFEKEFLHHECISDSVRLLASHLWSHFVQKEVTFKLTPSILFHGAQALIRIFLGRYSILPSKPDPC